LGGGRHAAATGVVASVIFALAVTAACVKDPRAVVVASDRHVVGAASEPHSGGVDPLPRGEEEPASTTTSVASSPTTSSAEPQQADPALVVAPPAAPGRATTPVASPPTRSPQPPPPPPPPPSSPPPPHAASPGVQTYAVVIGINNYSGPHADLAYAVADASELDRALSGFNVPSSHRRVLRDGQATRGSLVQALDWLVRTAGPEDTAVFFFAGHVGKVTSTREAIVLSDGAAVTDAELAQMLRPLAARTWIVIAACYGGGFTEMLAPGRILTGGAGANSLAYENSGFGHSYLVEYMIRRAMVERRAASSVEAAFAWASAELRREHPDRMPVQHDQASGELRLGAMA
jgi:hypothetical protein